MYSVGTSIESLLNKRASHYTITQNQSKKYNFFCTTFFVVFHPYFIVYSLVSLGKGGNTVLNLQHYVYNF